jgi:hypothetical protein
MSGQIKFHSGHAPVVTAVPVSASITNPRVRTMAVFHAGSRRAQSRTIELSTTVNN